jgi:hypothetical protein
LEEQIGQEGLVVGREGPVGLVVGREGLVGLVVGLEGLVGLVGWGERLGTEVNSMTVAHHPWHMPDDVAGVSSIQWE